MICLWTAKCLQKNVRPNHGQGLDLAEGEGGDGVEADIEPLLRGGRQTRKLKIRVAMFYLQNLPKPLILHGFHEMFSVFS